MFKNELQQQFKTLFDALGITQTTLAVWFYHTKKRSGCNYISCKYTGAAPVTANDVSLLQAITILKTCGYDIANVSFAANGDIELPLKMTLEKSDGKSNVTVI